MAEAATFVYEAKYREQGKQYIVGLDEVGRGCWAGPLVACAYVFHTVPIDIVLIDSKKTTEKQREALVIQLRELGAFAIGEVSSEEIDRIGLQAAQYTAYERAIRALPRIPDMLLLDGRPWSACICPHEAIVKGDAKVASIAAAAIIAKHYRDTYMKTTAHEQYPNYGFADHVGYGTKQHQAALRTYGVTALHRRSFKPIQGIV